ncbi:MAG: hypothetical protein QG657_3290, partial [Acidobacteriota bacterium]|nr:hypothetical protein [Acidobacteriota bacterium]
GLTENAHLTFMINGDTGAFPPEQMETFARTFKNALRQIAGHCAGIEETILTPADFGAKDLSLEELETIYEHFDRHIISKIYHLSPMQEGMLFHYLYDPHDRAYTMQLVYSLEGDVDAALLKKSIDKLIESREIFRTAFIYKGVKKPRQVILKSRESEFTYHDSSYEEQPRGFDLQKDILLRFTLIKAGPAKYTLLITYHHIIMDGWSTNLWLKDFLDIYCDMKSNKVPRWQMTPPYSSYIQWLERQDIGAANAYWRNYLDGFDHAAQIQPHETGAVAEVGIVEYKRGEYADKIAKETTVRLMELANRLGVTLNTVFQVVWGVVFSRHTNEEDIVFGNVISGRNIPLVGVEHIVGLFINTVPLRMKIHGRQKFEELVRGTGENFAASQVYGYLSLAEVQALAPQAAKGGRMFEHLFIFENYPVNKDLTGPGLAEKTGFSLYRQYSIEQTNYDLNIVIIPREDLVLRFQYNENVYSKNFVMRLSGYIERVIEQIVLESGGIVSDIEIVTGQEKRRLLYEFNDTDAAYPNDKTIHQLFEEQASKTPDHIAVVGAATVETLRATSLQITYCQLNQQSDHLAAVLIEKGVLADSVVGIMMERSIEMIIGIYGILKAGGAYLPIDPSYPRERINYMLADSNAKILLGMEECRKEIIVNCQLLIVNCKLLIGCPRRGLHHSNHLAYLIYTSGSTGKPKGVMIEHRSLVNRLNWMQKKYPIGPGDTILHKTSFTFDVSVWEIFWWSMVGARVCLLAPGGEKDHRQIAAAIYREHVTVMHFVPSMLGAFLDYTKESGAPGVAGRLSTLKQVFASGESLTVPLVKRFNEILNIKNKTRLANLYGPTEVTVDVSFYDCPEGQAIERVPIGRPIDNTGLVVVSKGGRVQPIGVPGELCIGGVGLARGYLNRPELTAEKFINKSFSGGAGGRFYKKAPLLYRTGDLARWLHDGNIEFLGRIDQQVKIRGNRIELGEIEVLLNRHIAVKESVVIAVNDPSGESCLCAYIVNEDENREELSVEQLRAFLGKTLPEYMIPSYFVPIEKIPLTASGKVDRRSLPAIEPGKILRTGATYVKPGSEIEEKLVALWQDILKVQGVGIHDNFFSLGGHSLKAMNFIGQVYKTFDLEIPLRIIFDKPTIAGIAQWLEDKIEKRRKLAQILHEIEALSDEQVNELISNMCYNNNGG